MRCSSSGESEKKEVSDADTSPDRTKRSRAVTIAMTDPAVGALKLTAHRAAASEIKIITGSIML
jgi:hypothetical protein